MRFWSRQSPNFSLTTGHVDHAKSPYAETRPNVLKAYQELAARLGTDQIVWCCTLADQHLVVVPGQSWTEWVLDVPPEGVLAFVDSLVWNRILDIKCCLPRSWSLSWQQEARRLYPCDATKQGAHERQREEEFWSQAAPGGSWWNALFVEGRADETVNALVRHPLKAEWVLKEPRRDSQRRRAAGLRAGRSATSPQV